MPLPDRVIWEWTDVAGGFVRSANYLAAGTSPVALGGGLQSDSNALLQMFTFGHPVVSALLPTTGQYQLVSDMAQLIFATGAGTTVAVVIPGPLASTFGPTSNVVNPLDPVTAAVIAAVIGTLTDVSGNPVTAYVSGIKVSRRTEQV